MKDVAGPGGADEVMLQIKLVVGTDGVVAFISGGETKIKWCFIISK
ncbi:hypothetical protein [Chitinophaga sp. OAE865]